jgi:hypothetical protein
MLIVGSSGSGKTQAIQAMLLNDLYKDDQTTIVIDSQHDLINNIKHLRIPKDRLVCIEPDISYPLALNLFDIGQKRFAQYQPQDREMFRNGLVELYDYIFGALGSDLTSKQSTAFRYVVRLMMEIPNATINTMVELFQKGGTLKYLPYIGKLSPPGQIFFKDEFDGQGFSDTRQQILRRLLGILENEIFYRMFSHTESKLNIKDELDIGGKIILINTDKARLKDDGSRFFGRFMIGMIYQAIMERALIPNSERMPTYLYIDECQDYLDNRLGSMLEQVRKYKCGLVLATQGFSHFTPEMKDAAVNNTAIKLIGSTAPTDAALLARSIGGKEEFLVHTRPLTFIEHIKGNFGGRSIDVPYGAMEAKPRRNDMYALRDMTRQKYCTQFKDKQHEVRTMLHAAEPEPVDYSPRAKKKDKP